MIKEGMVTVMMTETVNQSFFIRTMKEDIRCFGGNNRRE